MYILALHDYRRVRLVGRVCSAASFVVLLTISGLAGCGKSWPELFPVSGTVTLDGRPLAEGLIYFRTIQTGDIEPIEIKNGQFFGKAKPGDRRVEISAFRVELYDSGGMKAKIQQNLVPKCYNLDSTLTAKVSSEGDNQFQFTLKSK